MRAIVTFFVVRILAALMMTPLWVWAILVTSLAFNVVLSVPKPCEQGLDPKQDTLRLWSCPVVIGDQQPGVCRFREDGTVESFLGERGWVKVEN